MLFKRSEIALLFILVLAATGCGGEHTVVAPADPAYPTTITLLPANDLAALRSDFQARYPRVCSDLDEYGHPVERTGNSRLSCPPSVGIDVDEPMDELIEVAKTAMADMFDFTGVSDPSTLLIRRTVVSGETPFVKSRLIVDFANQRYKGREVLSTRLLARVDSLGVFAVRGHHFPEIHLPAVRFPAVAAQARIVGLEIPWYDVLGREQIFVVTRDSFTGDPVQAIRPQKVGDAIELRVAWEIGVGWQGDLSWYVYVDVATGETLATRQLFAT
jgi:hypothetical protein